MGACWIEKHFTLDKGLPGPDHRFSADADEFRELVEAIRAVESCLGEECVKPTLGEMRGRQDFRLSCVAACDLPAGHLLTSCDITFCRPGTGLPPKAIDRLIGQRLGHAVASGQVLGGGDFQ
ncbi:MAG: N-acetylneuraminate synthase family protein [Armatimonadetes bacterium]|nr:N-acetylneuraminate synthase family protein [Armatimonadota bacterium]